MAATGWPSRPRISSSVPAVEADAWILVAVEGFGVTCCALLLVLSRSSNMSKGLDDLFVGALDGAAGLEDVAGESKSKSQGSLEVNWVCLPLTGCELWEDLAHQQVEAPARLPHAADTLTSRVHWIAPAFYPAKSSTSPRPSWYRLHQHYRRASRKHHASKR